MSITYIPVKKIIITGVICAFFLSACEFESDKDYKSEQTEDIDSLPSPYENQQHQQSKPERDAQKDPNSTASDSASQRRSSDSTADTTVRATEKPTASVKNPGKKARATMAEWSASNNEKKEMDKDGIYMNADVMPEYPGGPKAIQQFIENNIQYPETAVSDGIAGTVQLIFAIDENGKVYNARAVGNPTGYGLEQEALRVINKMPRWKPGKVNGKNVKTRLSLPVVFEIS
jgi:TonB family protein